MDSYAARLICVAALMGAAALSATLFGNAEVQSSEDPRPMIVQQQTQTSRTAAEQEAQQGYYIAIRTTLPQTENVEIFDTAGNRLQILPVAADGQVTAGPLAPGCYRTWNRSLGSVQFMLLDNAALEVRGGNGWSDGEILYLKGGDAACVQVTVCIGNPTARTELLTLSLQDGNGDVTDRSVYLPPEEQTERSVLFDGVSPGVYNLLVNGQYVQSLSLSADAPVCAVTLDAPLP